MRDLKEIGQDIPKISTYFGPIIGSSLLWSSTGGRSSYNNAELSMDEIMEGRKIEEVKDSFLETLCSGGFAPKRRHPCCRFRRRVSNHRLRTTALRLSTLHYWCTSQPHRTTVKSKSQYEYHI